MKHVRYTSVVRRGLESVRALCLDSFDPSRPPSETVVKGWTRRQEREFNAAMAWIEQEARDDKGEPVFPDAQPDAAGEPVAAQEGAGT